MNKTDIKNIKHLIFNEALFRYYNDSDKLGKIKKVIESLTKSDLENYCKKENIQKNISVLTESYFGALNSLVGMIFYTPLWLSYRTIKAFGSQCERKCGFLKVQTDKRKACVIQCQIIQAEKALALARQAQSRCRDSKDPEFCFEESANVIMKIQQYITKKKIELSNIQKRM